MYLQKIASGASILAGLSHITFQAIDHMNMPFYLGGFLLVGTAQIILGVLLWKEKLTTPLFWMATLINGGATIFWLLTRTMMAPFMGGTEHFSILGVSVVVLQIISIALLCIQWKKITDAILVVLASLGLGFASHFGAMQLEHFFPNLKGSVHHHGGGHHQSSNMHNNHMMDMKDSHKKSALGEVKETSCEEKLCLTPQLSAEISSPTSDDTPSSESDNHENGHGSNPH